MKKNNKTKKIITIVIAAMMILTVGFGMGMSLNPNERGLIGKDAAIEIALTHAGVPEEQVMNISADLTLEGVRRIYDVEFTANGIEFWYEIVASTGQIYDLGQERVGFVNENAPHIENPINLPETPTPPSVLPAGDIDQEMAIVIALDHAGLSLQEVTGVNVTIDVENGRPIFDVEFRANGMEFWYEIFMSDGSIHDFGSEIDD